MPVHADDGFRHQISRTLRPRCLYDRLVTEAWMEIERIACVTGERIGRRL